MTAYQRAALWSAPKHLYIFEHVYCKGRSLSELISSLHNSNDPANKWSYKQVIERRIYMGEAGDY